MRFVLLITQIIILLVLSLIGKVLEALIYSGLVKDLTSHGHLSDKYDFCFSCSTTDVLMVITEFVQALDKNGKV